MRAGDCGIEGLTTRPALTCTYKSTNTHFSVSRRLGGMQRPFVALCCCHCVTLSLPSSLAWPGYEICSTHPACFATSSDLRCPCIWLDWSNRWSINSQNPKATFKASEFRARQNLYQLFSQPHKWVYVSLSYKRLFCSNGAWNQIRFFH